MTILTSVIGRGTTTAKGASSPKAGRLWFDTDLGKLQRYNGSTWDDCAETVSGTNALTKISETIVGVGGAASVDITSIPDTYTHLELWIYGRGDTGATYVAIGIRFNNDSGANYDFEQVQGVAAAMAVAENLGQTSNTVALLPAGSSSADIFSGSVVQIPYYANAVGQKMVSAVGQYKTAVTSGNIHSTQFAGSWRNTAAIDRITVILSAGNLVQGSIVTLYGKS